MIEKQIRLIREGKWDVMIVLDACRYDFFKREFGNHLVGFLRKVWSPASNTYYWLKAVYGNGIHDITVYGAHPVLNSSGIGREKDKSGFVAKPHFRKIVDIWDKYYDEKLGTVPSGPVVDHVLNDENFSVPAIVWLMQPHGPWIGEFRIAGSRGREEQWSVKDMWRKLYGGAIDPKILRKAYRSNLIYVLGEIKRLVNVLSQRGYKIVITSDHGEMLGEKGMFDHPAGREESELRVVPWLECWH